MKTRSPDEYLKGRVQISIKGKPLDLELSVPAKPVKPQRVLPVLQDMTNTFVRRFKDDVAEEGKSVSCKPGCTACCWQLIPISKIEAYQLAKLVRNMPALQKKKVVRRFEEAVERLDKTGWFEELIGKESLSDHERRELGLRYLAEGIPCPFLEKDLCSIHQDRPLGCREHLVTSPAENCSNPSAANIEMVPMPVKLSSLAYSLSKELAGGEEAGFIPLVSALKWVQENPDSYPQKPGVEWMDGILRKLKPDE